MGKLPVGMIGDSSRYVANIWTQQPVRAQSHPFFGGLGIINPMISNVHGFDGQVGRSSWRGDSGAVMTSDRRIVFDQPLGIAISRQNVVGEVTPVVTYLRAPSLARERETGKEDLR